MLQVEAGQLRGVPVRGQHTAELVVVHQQQLELLLPRQACRWGGREIRGKVSQAAAGQLDLVVARQQQPELLFTDMCNITKFTARNCQSADRYRCSLMTLTPRSLQCNHLQPRLLATHPQAGCLTACCGAAELLPSSRARPTGRGWCRCNKGAGGWAR